MVAAFVLTNNRNVSSKTPGTTESSEAVKDTAAQSADAVERRVREIYDEVFGWYVAHVDAPCENDFDSEEIFSKDYWQAYSSVNRLDTDGDGTFFFDYDHWIQAQDWDKDLAMHIESVEMQEDGRAIVHTHITNCGIQTPLDLAMTMENGRWLIDDFISPQQGNRSEKTDMKAYVEGKSNS